MSDHGGESVIHTLSFGGKYPTSEIGFVGLEFPNWLISKKMKMTFYFWKRFGDNEKKTLAS